MTRRVGPIAALKARLFGKGKRPPRKRPQKATPIIPPLDSGRPLDPHLGTVVADRYQIREVIGLGGMGRVYKAYQESVDRIVAIKIMMPTHKESRETVARRFEQEALAASRLSHPNTITVHDFGRIPKDGSLFIVMEYVNGRPLDRVMGDGAIMPERVLRIVSQVCGSLAEAHGEGIIHRDIKPGNIVIGKIGGQPDFVKVLDFGIAKLTDSALELTQDGMISGTPPYMSPEQILSKPYDARADLYSLGALTYEMLLGKRMWDASTAMSILFHHVHDPPRRFATVRPDLRISPLIESIVMRMVAKDPADRFQTAREIKAAVDGLLQDPKMWMTGDDESMSVAVSTATGREGANESETYSNPFSSLTPASGIPQLEKLLEENTSPTSEIHILAALGDLYEKKGERETALKIFQRIAAIYARRRDEAGTSDRFGVTPSSRDLPRLIGEIDACIKANDITDGIARLRQAFAIDPHNQRLLDLATGLYQGSDRLGLNADERVWLEHLVGERATLGHRVASVAVLQKKHDLVSVEAMELVSAYGGTFTLPRFLLQRTPVTNQQYKKFIDATGELPPDDWPGVSPPKTRVDHPVVGISFARASAYAEWCGLRLPSNLEWEAAARGPDGRTFPWGQLWDPKCCHHDASDSAAVGKYTRGASPAGCLDMIGNVWEWTVPAAKGPQPEPGYQWVFGGSFRHSCHHEGKIARTSVAKTSSYPYLGFRCAMDL